MLCFEGPAFQPACPSVGSVESLNDDCIIGDLLSNPFEEWRERLARSRSCQQGHSTAQHEEESAGGRGRKAVYETCISKV
jgi:hypothetical protein